MKRGLRPTAGDGRLTSDGPLWKRQRKLIQPAFLHDRLGTFGAGHETTAVALTWTWYLLSRPPSVSNLPRLSYTEMVVREALRLYPPAPGFAREPIENVIIGGYEVPKGSLITISPYVLHHDRRFFSDPERFDPERFAHSWEERIPRHAYLPFGGGPRILHRQWLCTHGGAVDLSNHGTKLPAIDRSQ